MAFINGYSYPTETEAIAARQTTADYITPITQSINPKYL